MVVINIQRTKIPSNTISRETGIFFGSLEAAKAMTVVTKTIKANGKFNEKPQASR